MEKEWTRVVGKMTYGIYVLTACYKDEINAMIASWVSQVSYDPPLIMIAVHPNRYTHQLIEQGGCFVLHALSRKQKEFLTRFKGPDPATKFSALEWKRGETGCPILRQCVAYAECRIVDRYRPGNHTLFIGEIVEATVFSEEDTLNTSEYGGQYHGKE